MITRAHADDFPVIIVGGRFNGKYTRKEVVEKFCNGEYTKDKTELRKEIAIHGGCTSRPELDCQPKIDGYAGPMWDGEKLRYEDWEVYELMSCDLLSKLYL